MGSNDQVPHPDGPSKAGETSLNILGYETDLRGGELSERVVI
jgi:hypothetical protein